jgi:hypothetical protein
MVKKLKSLKKEVRLTNKTKKKIQKNKLFKICFFLPTAKRCVLTQIYFFANFKIFFGSFVWLF